MDARLRWAGVHNNVFIVSTYTLIDTVLSVLSLQQFYLINTHIIAKFFLSNFFDLKN